MIKKGMVFILCSLLHCAYGQELLIQENEEGFCYIDGIIDTDLSGYTGSGYADTDRGVGKSISWSVFAEQDDLYLLYWRYSNGGGSGDRPGRLLINGDVARDTVHFPLTGSGRSGWENWTASDTLPVQLRAGHNQLRLEAYSADGLANFDYISFPAEGLERGNCIPSFTVRVKANKVPWGSILIDPEQLYYETGTLVSVSAQANPGYFFQSWTGDLTSADSSVQFSVQQNMEIEAIFLPQGATMDSSAVGYVTVQDDLGTPFLLTGGTLGDTVEAISFEMLAALLSDSLPHVVTLSQKITGSQNIKVTSDKTITGLNAEAHLQGIGLEISQARNVIVRNIKISHVTPQDAIEINASKNIWIDHCELFSDRDHGPDYYDGLIDIKNASSFITISWSVLHDHYKTSLISSGDQAAEDSVSRVTWHHNYFYNCESRLPSIRFGRAHIFNNYYKNCSTAINSRMGACVRIEKNYFNNVSTAVMMAFSPEPGFVQLIDNHFGSSYYVSSPLCELNVPYPYEHVLDETDMLPIRVAGDVTALPEQEKHPAEFSLSNQPNPFNTVTNIEYSVKANDNVPVHLSLAVYSLLGQKLVTLVNERQKSGSYKVPFNAGGLSSGIYIYLLRTKGFIASKKMLLLK